MHFLTRSRSHLDTGSRSTPPSSSRGRKKNVLLQRRYSHPVDKSTGISSDQTVILTSFESASSYPDPLRRVGYRDSETGRRLRLPTNKVTLPAIAIADIIARR
jgi:hypothetical protein